MNTHGANMLRSVPRKQILRCRMGTQSQFYTSTQVSETRCGHRPLRLLTRLHRISQMEDGRYAWSPAQQRLLFGLVQRLEALGHVHREAEISFIARR